VAYTPRIGAPLCRSTQQRFRELDVDHRRIRGHNEYPFYNFFNKPLAVATAEEEVETDQIAWIDGDMLCVGDLEGLLLDADHDVAACPCDSYPGTTGPGSDHEAYWRAICELHGLSTEDLPWVTTVVDRQRVRLYFNAGLFLYRRSADFGKRYLESVQKILRNHVSSHRTSIHYGEQVAFAVTIVAAGLRYRLLEFKYNYTMAHKFSHIYERGAFEDARLIHYHDSLWPKHWENHLRRMTEEGTSVAPWLSSRGPLRNPSPLPYRVAQKVLRSYRERQEDRYRAQCRVY